MFPKIRNLQIRVHVYRPHHCCGDILHKIALKYWMKIKNVEIWIQLLLTLSFEFIYKTERDRGNRTAYSRKLLMQ
jgi:hypothetical protein